MPANKKRENLKSVKLKYNSVAKRSYLGRLFPSADQEKNIIELSDNELIATFLRMKIGKEKLWTIFKEKPKLIREDNNDNRS